ncbi:LAETG motif-containing sortase-dependent surface protein [Streptomyces sp. NPDC055036]
MSVARRPLLTATAAGTLLCALWFVPSAKATEEQGGPREPAVSARSLTAGESEQLTLADTGGVDTTPYLVGGSLCLGIGAGFVAYSRRRGARVPL